MSVEGARYRLPAKAARQRFGGVPKTQSIAMKTKTASPHKGNKQSLPSKLCVACRKPMTWRKRWARDWDQVKYCSDRCRKSGAVASCA